MIAIPLNTLWWFYLWTMLLSIPMALCR